MRKIQAWAGEGDLEDYPVDRKPVTDMQSDDEAIEQEQKHHHRQQQAILADDRQQTQKRAPTGGGRQQIAPAGAGPPGRNLESRWGNQDGSALFKAGETRAGASAPGMFGDIDLTNA